MSARSEDDEGLEKHLEALRLFASSSDCLRAAVGVLALDVQRAQMLVAELDAQVATLTLDRDALQSRVELLERALLSGARKATA